MFRFLSKIRSVLSAPTVPKEDDVVAVSDTVQHSETSNKAECVENKRLCSTIPLSQVVAHRDNHLTLRMPEGTMLAKCRMYIASGIGIKMLIQDDDNEVWTEPFAPGDLDVSILAGSYVELNVTVDRGYRVRPESVRMITPAEYETRDTLKEVVYAGWRKDPYQYFLDTGQKI